MPDDTADAAPSDPSISGGASGATPLDRGAHSTGVDVFLVPVAGDNAREAKRYAHGLRIIPVKSFAQALHALATLPPKH